MQASRPGTAQRFPPPPSTGRARLHNASTRGASDALGQRLGQRSRQDEVVAFPLDLPPFHADELSALFLGQSLEDLGRPRVGPGCVRADLLVGRQAARSAGQARDRPARGESDRVPLARVRIRVAEGSTSSLHMATAILEELLSLHELQHHWYFVIETQIWQAMAYSRLGEPEAALAALDAAIQRAVPSGIVGLFTLHGQPMKELLYALRKRTSTPDLVDLLLATFPGFLPTGEGEDELGKLTEREIEVLRLLADGLSNKEIAQRLIISTNTVRNHMANIFDKLEVDSRTRAVARARSLGLVSGRPTSAPAGKVTD